jgi:hypothetical protein
MRIPPIALHPAAFVLLTLGFACPDASAAIISVDWANGSGGVGATTVMGLGETAGVVSASNWNSFLIQTSPTTGGASGLLNDAGATTAASLTWSYNNPWSINVTDTAGNNRMMRGYLDSGAATTTMVSFSNIPFALYDVYVYADGDNGVELRSGSYTIGATTLINTDAANTNFSGTFTQGANYVKFSNLAGASFTLNATPVAGPTSPRAPVNAIQIVEVPEPTHLALGAIGALTLLVRRKRAH